MRLQKYIQKRENKSTIIQEKQFYEVLEFHLSALFKAAQPGTDYRT